MTKLRKILKIILECSAICCYLFLFFILIRGKFKDNFLLTHTLISIPILDILCEIIVIIKTKEDNMIRKIWDNVYMICCLFIAYTSLSGWADNHRFVQIILATIILINLSIKLFLWIRKKIKIAK